MTSLKEREHEHEDDEDGEDDMLNPILIVDDQPDMAKGLGLVLEDVSKDIVYALSAEEALVHVKKQDFDLVITDLKMPGMSGLELLQRVKAAQPKCAVIVMTAYGTIEGAVEAMTKGAYHYITKPFNNDEVLITVKRALAERRFQEELEVLRQEVTQRYSFHNIVGKDPRMRQIFQTIGKVGPFKAAVLIQGESGTGKELIAKAIHYQSPRKDRRFVGINAAALPENLLEAELFGYRKGAFTGADTDRRGLLVEGSGGTVFFDEISNMSPAFQAKLLRGLQEMEVVPLGTNEPIKVDVRVIAATNQDLDAAVKEGSFREDLYYRLNVVRINVPPLRDRADDIPLLANHFLRKCCEEYKLPKKTLSAGAVRVLMSHNWPGNVRELENAIHRAVLASDGETLEAHHIGLGADGMRLADEVVNDRLSYDEAKSRVIDSFQKQYFTILLARCNGNVSLAAERCGITRAALHRIIKKHGLTSEE